MTYFFYKKITVCSPNVKRTIDLRSTRYEAVSDVTQTVLSSTVVVT